ncbi:uncharacterized protein LOC127750747 [Frankliniella occidentalis]|uniref:Uncharacterized protein LOC127750747 n=1 Tax=Frankliniella occidentalis TaxID=133901 RepID=A0A9C6X4U9_FRAOC|nr:uncharacterized protein LOC127750747 [Frankliniella occidentalis]
MATVTFQVRALLCGDTSVTADAAAEWTCWQPRATSFWNCAQQTGWTGNPQACQLLDKLSECYEHVAAEWCGAGSGRTARRVILRALAPLPESQCPELERAAKALKRDKTMSWLLFVGVAILANILFALVVLGCCTWYRRRRLRHEKLQEEPT